MELISLATMLFIGVNLDFFLILLVLLQKYKLKDVLIGYELGMLVIFRVSATVGQLIQNVIPEWAIGFLGMIPIIVAVKGEEESNIANHSNTGIIAVMLMYLVSCGADNIAVYVPVLSTMNLTPLMITLTCFIIITFLSTFLSSFVSDLPSIKKIFTHWGENISRIIYGSIGVFVFFETGLIDKLIELF